MKTFFAFTVLFLSFYLTFAQDNSRNFQTSGFNEQELNSYVEQILSIEDDEQRLSINEALKSLLKTELQKKGAFNFPFDSLTSMSVLTPADSAFRLFNWSVPMNDGSYNYECFMLQRGENGNQLTILKPILVDTIDVEFEKFKGNANEWPQALYYKIISKETFNRKYYTLLAWDGHNRLTKRKWIEVFWFDRNGELQMGAPIFKQERKARLLRPVFRYSAQHAMKMDYNPSKDRIEFDYLAPENSRLEGVYEYYFPDVTQDAFRWNNDYWEFEKLIDNEEKSKRDKKRIEKQKKEIILENGAIYESN